MMVSPLSSWMPAHTPPSAQANRNVKMVVLLMAIADASALKIGVAQHATNARLAVQMEASRMGIAHARVLADISVQSASHFSNSSGLVKT